MGDGWAPQAWQAMEDGMAAERFEPEWVESGVPPWVWLLLLLMVAGIVVGLLLGDAL